jgi:hypothetical protein
MDINFNRTLARFPDLAPSCEALVALQEKHLDVFMQAFRTDVMYVWHFGLLAVITRSLSLHEAICQHIEGENIAAAFALLRAHIETMALMFYLSDHPKAADALTESPRRSRKTVPSSEKLIGLARRRKPWVGKVYGWLSEFAHFGSKSVWSPITITSPETREIEFSTRPKWRMPLLAETVSITGEVSQTNVQLVEAFLADRYREIARE